MMFDESAYRIRVDGKYCYKESLFSTKGWCILAPIDRRYPDPTDGKEWGFCTSSCDLEFITVRNIIF